MLDTENDYYSMTPLPDLDNLPDKSYREKLTILLKFVKNWSKFEGMGSTAAIEFFMMWVGHLYLQYFQNHLEEAKACGLEHKETLCSIMEPIVEEYIYWNWQHFSTMGCDIDVVWADMCEVATNLQAFQEMFGEMTGPFTGWVVKEFYEDLEAQKGAAIVLREDQIPKNMPRAHWWWFYESKVTPEEWDEFFKRYNEETK